MNRRNFIQNSLATASTSLLAGRALKAAALPAAQDPPDQQNTPGSIPSSQIDAYGLTWVDFRTQKRTIKDPGLWYGRVAASNRLNV